MGRIEELLSKANKEIENNEKIIFENEIKKEVKTAASKYNEYIKEVEDWAVKTAYELSNGEEVIAMKTSTLAELFKTIYISASTK